MGERKGVRVNYAGSSTLYPNATDWRLEKVWSTDLHNLLVIYEGESRIAQHSSWTSVEFEDAK